MRAGCSMSAASRSRLAKPVLIWKAATTDAGVKAAASHTANMTGSYDLYRAAMRQSGLIEVDDVEPIVDIAKLFAQGRLPERQGRRRAVDLRRLRHRFADRAVRAGLTLPHFSEPTLAALRKIIPSFGSAENPADVTAGVFNDMACSPVRSTSCWPTRGSTSCRFCWPRSAGRRRSAQPRPSPRLPPRPTSRCTSPGPAGAPSLAEAVEGLRGCRRPVLTTPVRLAQAAAVLARFADDRRRLLPRRRRPVSDAGRPGPTRRRPSRLNEAESKAVLRAFGVPVAREVLVSLGADAAAAAAGLRPVCRQDRLARHRPQDRGRRRQAVRGEGRPRRCRPHRHRQREARPSPAPRSTACSSPKWRKASRC